MDPVEQLLHPVRLRIVHALSAAGTLTVAQMCARMPEIPKITLYRQVAQLTEGGFVEVDGEQRVRGAVERRYRLRRDRPAIDAGAAAAMSPDDHRRGFAAAMAVLIAEFNAYLDREGADPAADSVSYRQGTLWLSPDELTAMTADLLAVLRDRLANAPAPGRAPYLLSAILFPAGQPPTPPAGG
ncbi:helix-turn-helix domain-containing protein [Nonomuraea roseoviolacea subsp. roseoviolacea]|uniref:DNA-binding transcriptional ArsR family regulator n=1 Tax=Nonomuraea roseoviolacea subsp. carminata TaxID=160689 RepID=A0ABT1JQN9_9ACTN|nr:helix-turn-helix domain-containing protein [Nonomuraea roseoviolacea]MCP2344048.1 DNA-binding transcriptional ArsR family regulator [Nonomuraea roseoviolacea subsp. carminata]